MIQMYLKLMLCGTLHKYHLSQLTVIGSVQKKDNYCC